MTRVLVDGQPPRPLGEATAADEDRLPWLEAVDDEEAGRGPGAGRLVAAVIVALAIIGLIVGGIFWLRDRRGPGPDGEGELIAAPPGAYKTKPGDPGGLAVEGQGDTTYAASEGADRAAAIDLSALPEAPVAGGVTSADAAAAQKTATPAPTPKAPAPATPATAAPAGTIQLGAFSSEAKASAAWKSLSARYAYLKPLTSNVVPVNAAAGTLYRLRVAAGGQAGSVCAKLKVAGESCVRVD